MISPAASAAPAAWLLRASVGWWDLVRYGPPGFEVFARIDLGNGSGREGELPALRVAIAVLAGHTSTPAIGYAAVWEGCLDPVPDAPRVPVPNREMVLLTGPVDELRDAPRLTRGDAVEDFAEPHLVWPEDQAWCVACDVDEEIAFSVGCSADAYAALETALPGQVRPATYGEDTPLYRE